MNAEEFELFLKETNSTILSPPVSPCKANWREVYDNIRPHFYGLVPSALDKAFPNEDGEILKYRKSTYQPKTESPLVKAITELHRLLSGAKHSIKFENQEMQKYINETKIGDYDFTKFFFSSFVSNRALDPNAVFLVNPYGDGLLNPAVSVELEYKIIQSDRIIFNDPEYNLLIYKGSNKNKYASTFTLDTVYYIVTDMFYAKVETLEVGTEFELIYNHNSGINPWVTLGGRSVPKYDSHGNVFHYYKSDFSPAMPYLNDAAIFDNQHKSVMLAACFPVKFVEGIDCYSCHGLGKIYNDKTDSHDSCHTCEGRGKLPSWSPLAAYNINPSTSKFGDENKVQTDPIRYYSPDISSISEVGKVAEQALNKAEQVLNINRSLKSAQSGIAKELDREPEYIEVGKISDDIYMRMHDVLKVIQALKFMDYESEIIVNAPISFDLKTESELMNEFAESQKGLPVAIRFEAYISYIDRRYNADNVAKRIAALCAMYSSAYLYTGEERVALLASGQIMLNDCIAAQYVFDALTTLYYEKDFDIMTDDWKSIKTAIDAELQPLYALAAVSVPPEVDIDEFNNPDEE